MTQTQKVIIGIVVVLVLGIILVFAFGDDDNDLDLSLNDNAATTTGLGTTTGLNDQTGTGTDDAADANAMANTILLSDNEVGMNIVVDYVNLTDDGFVSLYRVNSNGDVVEIGSSDLLTAGIHQDVDISLTEGVVNDQAVVAVLFTDENGDGEFDTAAGDMPVRSASGSIVTDLDIVDQLAEQETDEMLAEIQAEIEAGMEE